MEDKAQIRHSFRQILLEQLAHNKLNANDLRQLVASGALECPDLFDDYQVSAIVDAIEPGQLDWNVGYFDRQRKMAQLNFSQKRIMHLIDVREYFFDNGFAGFTKAPAAGSSYGTQTMKTAAYSADFTPGENLAKMVQQGTVSLVRSALINELENNRLEDAEIERAVAWTLARINDLFVGYEENALAGQMINDPAQWGADYYDLQTSYVNSNFSAARFEHLITVRNALRQRGVKGFERIIINKVAPQPQSSSRPQSLSRPHADASSAPARSGFLRVALMAGGALAVLAALVISLL